MIDFKKIARKVEKKVGAYIHPNQIKRYMNNHKELYNTSEDEIIRKLTKKFWELESD